MVQASHLHIISTERLIPRKQSASALNMRSASVLLRLTRSRTIWIAWRCVWTMYRAMSSSLTVQHKKQFCRTALLEFRIHVPMPLIRYVSPLILHGRVGQLLLRPAYATKFNGLQGFTLDAVARGQLYTALSRVQNHHDIRTLL
ncbi:hypothetical protein BDR03DRAFT_394276 [Suillus americanus]|nr:hypothetical protein BDR03DRAFT_394276 [Suillus americanus]